MNTRFDVLDQDGENRAVRSFLMQYSCDRAISVHDMAQHMQLSGWDGCWPAWVSTVDGNHLTKAGAQLWIRHLISLEPGTSADFLMKLDRGELDLCREWFDNVQDVNGAYLEAKDYVLAKRLCEYLGVRWSTRSEAELTRLAAVGMPAQQRAAARNSPSTALPTVTDEEMSALRRFHECVSDGEGYDVGKEMMRRLAGIGLVRRTSGSIYEHTDFGLFVLGEYIPTEAQHER